MPSAPRDFEVTLTQEDPPVASLTWRRPAQLNGQLFGYRLTYGSLADDFDVAGERLLDADKRRFTTGFLGQYDGTGWAGVGPGRGFDSWLGRG